MTARDKSFIWTVIWFLLGLLLVFSTAYFNPGVFALDDYTENIFRIFPTDRRSFLSILSTRSYRNPLPQLYLFSFGQVLDFLKIQVPEMQIRVVMGMLGVLNLSVLFYALPRIWEELLPEYPKDKAILYPLISFFSLAPFLYTRLMFETLCIPYFTLFIFFLVRYQKCSSWGSLALGMLFLALASLFRPHLGVCALVPFFLVLQKRSFLEFFVWVLICGSLFVLTGLFDWVFFGRLHDSLLQYIEYNLHHSSEFGVSHPFVYVGTFLILSFPPTFFYKWSQETWSKLSKMRLIFGMGALFILAHSLVPHKEERFIIPLLPLFYLTITAFLSDLWNSKRWVRLGYFLSLNFIFLFLSGFQETQKAVLDLAHYLDHSKILHIKDFERGTVLFPQAYMKREVSYEKYTLPFSMLSYDSMDCRNAFLMNEEVYQSLGKRMSDLGVVAFFEPSLGDRLLIRLNPRQNRRKDKLYLLQHKRCVGNFSKTCHLARSLSPSTPEPPHFFGHLDLVLW